jgi:hypothetical protein
LIVNKKGKTKMDLSIIQKVSELSSEGRNATEIKQELQAGGMSPELTDQALREAGVSVGPSLQQPAPASSSIMHHQKVIQPEAGFDLNAK